MVYNLLHVNKKESQAEEDNHNFHFCQNPRWTCFIIICYYFKKWPQISGSAEKCLVNLNHVLFLTGQDILGFFQYKKKLFNICVVVIFCRPSGNNDMQTYDIKANVSVLYLKILDMKTKKLKLFTFFMGMTQHWRQSLSCREMWVV